jgi:hypothetical protein
MAACAAFITGRLRQEQSALVRFNKDAVVALVLLVFAGGAFWQSLTIQTRNDGIMRADVWPQTIIFVLAILALIYLWQSVRAGAGPRDVPEHGGGFGGWLGHYANPIMCFGLYFLFLATLPWLGMLIGGVLLVFVTLTVLGGAEPRLLALHFIIGLVAIGFMWAIFTYGLRVSLPEGEILPLILPR